MIREDEEVADAGVAVIVDVEVGVEVGVEVDVIDVEADVVGVANVEAKVVVRGGGDGVLGMAEEVA